MVHISLLILFDLYICLYIINNINPLIAELNPICHLLALLEAHHILHVNRIRVNKDTCAINKGYCKRL